MPSDHEIEHERQVYEAFRNSLGEEGRRMSEEELRQEVDAFLDAHGLTLADVAIIDGRWLSQ